MRAEDEGPPVEPEEPEAAPEPTYPDWWQDPAEAEAPSPRLRGPGAPERPEVPAARAEEARGPERPQGLGVFGAEEREALANALYGPPREDDTPELKQLRQDGVNVLERVVVGTVGSILQGQQVQQDRQAEATRTAASKVQAGWEQLWRTAPELARFRGQAQEQDVMEIAEMELVRRGFGDARGQADPLKIAGMTRAQMTEVIRATQARAKRLLVGREPTPVGEAPEDAAVVETETTGAAAARSQGFAEKPAAQTPPGTRPRPSKEQQEAKEFLEGLAATSPPV